MNLVFVIDSLGAGGAQRQLVTLAKRLKSRGHAIRVITYNRLNHFKPILDEAGIAHHIVSSKTYIGRLLAIRRSLRAGCPDAVLAFLEAPSFYAEISSIPRRRWVLVVGERSAHPKTAIGWRRLIRFGHRFADAVVANSHSGQAIVGTSWPALRPKLSTIYNIIDLDRFKPGETGGNRDQKFSRVVIAASYHRMKNMLGVANALSNLRVEERAKLRVDWYGAHSGDGAALAEAREVVVRGELTNVLRFHGPKFDIEREYRTADAIGLFSMYEGLPNAVCEGMACGKPVLMSDVCDARNLVSDGETGFLCDPRSHESIAGAFRRLLDLSPSGRSAFGLRARRRAESLFDGDVIAGQYEEVFERCLRERLER